MKTIISAVIITILMAMPALATSWCSDNTTLIKNITYSDNGNSSFFELTDVCTYGCDNTTMLCAPPTYQQNLIIFGVIMAMVIVMLALVRLRRR